jgi:hypothetical protein
MIANAGAIKMGESTAEAELAELYRQKAVRTKEGKPVDITNPEVREALMARQKARLDKMAEVMKERGSCTERGEKMTTAVSSRSSNIGRRPQKSIRKPVAEFIASLNRSLYLS